VTDRPALTPADRADVVAALRGVPELANHELRLSTLPGGITNRNVLVEPVGQTSRYVLRLPGTDTHLLGISREVERDATLAAAAVGVGPEVIAFVRPQGYLLTRYIEGDALSGEAMHRADTLGRVADALRSVHAGPAIPGRFVPIRIVAAYRRLARDRGVVTPAQYEPSRAIADRVGLALRATAGELAPCHNDLVSTNFIDDGRRVRIVDWEYAAMGDPIFDLGNFSANQRLTPDEEATFLEAYDGRSVRRDRLGRLRLMRVMSHFREAMWGVVQEAISTLDVDFAAYAREHFERLLRDASTTEFEEALRDASRPGSGVTRG
jgi:thiamine kinase-like enzyme